MRARYSIDVSIERLDIVGAGSLGLLLANSLQDLDLEVVIQESKHQIGGITRDFYNKSGQQFFHGCHYMVDESLTTDLMLEDTSLKFVHRYASITKQDDKLNYKLDFAGPAFFLEDIHINADLIETKNMDQKLGCYPKEISNYLKRFAEKVVNRDLVNLNANSLASLGLNRVTVMENELELVAAKEQNPLVDQLFGVRRDLLGLDYEISYIPNQGYDIFWESLFHKMQNRTNHRILINEQINSKNIGRFLEPSKSRLVIWCADPRFLVQRVQGVKLDSHQYSIVTYGLILDSYTGPELPFYINIFSEATSLLRLYFYQTFSDVKVSIESVAPQINTQTLYEEIFKILDYTNITITISDPDIGVIKSKRYFPLTNHDYTNIYDAFRNVSNFNWLDSGSYIYARSIRYNMILRQLNQELYKSE